MKKDVKHYLAEVLPVNFPGFERNEVQLAYASSLEEALDLGLNKLSWIEGDTGIGKSLAYLLTLADWVAEGRSEGRRGLVATHSRSLQRQLVDAKNQAILQDYLSWRGLPSLSVAIRMGRANYISTARLAQHLGISELSDAEDEPDLAPKDRALAQWALETGGCLLDLDDADLPEGLEREDIALLPGEPIPQSLATHFSETADADILVINHALLVLDLVRNGAITGAEEPYALVVDESEHFPTTAENLLSAKVSLRSAVRMMRKLGARRASEYWQELLDSFTTPERASTAVTITASTHTLFQEAIEKLLKARPRRETLDSTLLAEWDQLREDARRIAGQLSGDYRQVILTYSPVYGLPSLLLAEDGAGRCLLANGTTRATIMTSATLSDLRHERNELPSFEHIRRRLAMGQGDTRIGLMDSHEARNFGNLSFNIPEIGTPPIERDGYGEFSMPATYAREAAEAVAGLEGRVLLLCVSYQDVEMLLSVWPEKSRHRLVTHRPGEQLTRLADEQLADDSILLSPAAWEGLSPARRGGRAFWQHVVLLRNPTPRPDSALELLLVQRLRKHHDGSEAQRMARGIIALRDRVTTLHKIRQGLGRAIRHHQDEVTVTILDPRFPRPGQSGFVGVNVRSELLGSIPFRFREAYRQAAVAASKPTSQDEEPVSRLALML